MENPYLVQRCTIEERNNRWSLIYDYMGSTEFEIGDQSKSLKRIFKKGLIKESLPITIKWSPNNSPSIDPHDHEHRVWMIAGSGFPFEKYVPMIIAMAGRETRLKEWTLLPELLVEGKDVRTDVWFDFENDVLFTFDKIKAKKLMGILEYIKMKWGC